MTLCDNGKAPACRAGLFCKGFTLIELLVVVLIIGILAAIALPQYRLAVGRAQTMKMAPIARAIYDAAERCKMVNGSPDNCANFENLDVQLPGVTYVGYTGNSMTGSHIVFAGKLRCWLRSFRSGSYVSCGRKGGGGLEEKAGYLIRPDGKAYCLASNYGAYDESKGLGHKICKSLGGVKTNSDWNDADKTSTYAYYKLP